MDFLATLFTGAFGAAIASGIFGVVMYRIKRRDELADKNDDIRIGVRMIMYDRIKHLGKSYIQRGSITTEELEDLVKMHGVYHNNLGGNGFLDNLMEQVKRLPIIG